MRENVTRDQRRVLRADHLALGPYGIWAVLFILVPLVFVAYYAFTDVNFQFTLENIQRFFTATSSIVQDDGSSAEVRTYLLIFWRSLKLAIISTLVCLVLGVGFAGNHSTAAPALGLTRITQGTLTGATGPVALTEDQQREVVELLNHTKKSSYTPCEDPGSPEGTVSLSNQDGSVEYRLLFQGTDLPRLVQVRSTGETRTCRSAAFSYSEAGDFLGGDRKNLIQK